MPGQPESSHLLSLLIFSPLVAALVAAFISNETLLRWWTLIFTTVAAIFSLQLYTGFDPSNTAFQLRETVNWIPRLKIQYDVGVDGISLLLILLTTIIMPLCVLCSWRYIQTRLKEFMICLLVMESAMVGVFSALDFILFFVFWEAMLIPMALLIGVWGGPRKIYAALKFFVYTMSGSVMLLVAIIALYLQVGSFSIPEMMGHPYSRTFQLWIFAAFFISFAIKVPMFPFHTWLPAAHVEAPTAGSVILASILLKMGTYGFIRFSLPITPDAAQFFMPYILWLSVAAILYGGLTALAQTDLKKLVAYSSVAHMGFATLGIFCLNRAGLEGAMLVMINHGVTTGALFIVVGIIYERLHTRELDKAMGIGKLMPIFTLFAGVFALSSLAFPGTNSFVGEFLVMKGGFDRNTLAMICAVPGVILAAAYMLRMLQKVAYGGTSNPKHSGLLDLNFREIATLTPLFVLVFWMGLNPTPFIKVFQASVRQVVNQATATAVTRGGDVSSPVATTAGVGRAVPSAPSAIEPNKSSIRREPQSTQDAPPALSLPGERDGVRANLDTSLASQVTGATIR